MEIKCVSLHDLNDYTYNDKYEVIDIIKNSEYIEDGQTQYEYKAVIKDVSYGGKLKDLIEDHQIYATIKVSNNPDDFMIVYSPTQKGLYNKLKKFFDSDESENWYIDFTGVDYTYNKNSQKIFYVYMWKIDTKLEEF